MSTKSIDTTAPTRKPTQKANQTGSASSPAASRIYEPSTILREPTKRPLKVYAFDPSSGHFLGNNMTALVPYEKVHRGPIGKKFGIIDFDGANHTYYTPVNLDDFYILVENGLDPAQSDPRFHQQMVYAVAAETLEHFETALGRNIHWRRGIRRLNLFPHAMPQANAFYSPEAHGILFGYFRASATEPGRNLPRQTVFTCLSHDIIAHETTHAIVDGIRTHFIEPTNIDVPAFHEAFADLAALFRHFSHKEALLETLQKTGGRLFQYQLKAEAERGTNGLRPSTGGQSQTSHPQSSGSNDNALIQAELPKENPLVQLAQQFGEGSGMRGGLRSALGTPPNAKDIKTKTEAHDRGAILVSAVFDAYFTTYTRRTADLFRIFRAGGGSNDPVDLPGPLASMLAAEASATAERFFLICARALDYCPPVDITFGDFLRAIITAHLDLDPEDLDNVRDAFMEAFRLRGIVAYGASYFSDTDLRWPKIDEGMLPPVDGLVFGDPNGLTTTENDENGQILRHYARTNAAALGFDLAQGEIGTPSFHPIFFRRSDGRMDVDIVVELVQTQRINFPDAAGGRTFLLRNGVTLLIWQMAVDPGKQNRPAPQIRFAIPKLFSPDRQNRQQALYTASGLAQGDNDNRFHINFGLLHGGL